MAKAAAILDRARWYHSIRWKLAVSYIVVSFAPLLFFYGTIMTSIEGHYVVDRQRRLMYQADMTASSLSQVNYLGNLEETAFMQVQNAALIQRSREGPFRIMVFDERFMVVKDTNFTQVGNTLIVSEVVSALTTGNGFSINREDAVIYAAVAIVNADQQRIGVVLLAEPATDIFESIEIIQQNILLYTLMTGVLMCVLVFLASRLLIGPLRGIMRVVQKMAEGHLNQRMEVTGYDEYSQLGRTFNTMSAKLEQVEKAREEFVSNVSHELKTPLSSIKVLAESVLLEEDAPIETYREFLQDITSEVDRMTFIVNDLLDLVKLDRRDQGLHLAAIDLNRLVEDVLKRLLPLADQKRISLLCEEVRQVTLDGDGMKLSLAISNIVENGIKYTPIGGTVRVTVDADHQHAFITIQDSGIGIPEEEQDKVFNRFYRVDKTRDRGTGGTGLGLAISHAAVLMHNGSLRLSSKPDEGSTFTIRLPLRKTV